MSAACLLATLAPQLTPPIRAHNTVTGALTSFTDLKGHLEPGYAGLGNQNESLAAICYTVPSNSNSVKVKFRLTGNGVGYITALRVWARPVNGTMNWGCSSGSTPNIDDVFALPYDYRTSVTQRDDANQNKILLGAISDQTFQAGTDYVITNTNTELQSGQRYVIYITANLKEYVPGELPPLTQQKTKIGVGTTRIGINENNLSSVTYDNSSITALTDGSRVLVPSRQTMFAPGDNYSKFYRIPAITTTTTGHIIAVSDARKYHPHDVANDIDVVCRISEDEGVTWGSPIIIAKGVGRDANGNALALDDKGMVQNLSQLSCDKSDGYGDIALAPLPGGNVLVTMIGGGGLASSDATHKTYPYWCVINDKGQLVHPLVPMDEELFKAYDLFKQTGVDNTKLYTMRGNIAPGNMCVFQDGPLKGKVMAALRTWYDENGMEHRRANLFLIFDPQTYTWHTFTSEKAGKQRLYRTYTTYHPESTTTRPWWQGGTTTTPEYEDGTSYQDDEAQLIELNHGTLPNGEAGSTTAEYNSLLMSVRTDANPYRAFRIVHARYDQATDTYVGYIDSKQVSATTGNNKWATAGNCNAIHYVDKNNDDYMLHTAISANNAAPQSGRSNLTVNYVKVGTVGADGEEDFNLNNTSTRFTLTDGPSLSDPLEAANETAQYSSIVQLRDGTIGLLFEEYPVSLRNYSDNGGKSEYLLRSVFMRMRINDIIPSSATPEKEVLLPPVITPKTQTYDWNQIADVHPDITVARTDADAEQGVTLHYVLTYTGTDNKPVEFYEYSSDQARSHAIQWAEILTILPEGKTFGAGTSLKVTAKTYKLEGTRRSAESAEVSEVYNFDYPVRKVMIQAHNVNGATGYGSPRLSAASQTVTAGIPVSIGVGRPVSIVAPNETRYKLAGFNLSATTPGSYFVNGAVYTMQAGGNQVNFNMGTIAAMPDNYDTDKDGTPDALCIHVWYNYNGAAVGVNSYLYSSYNGADLWKDGQNTGSQISSFSHSSSYTDTDVWHETITLANGKTVERPVSSTRDSFTGKTGNSTGAANLTMPSNWHTGDGLDLCLSLLPDVVTARDFNAVVMFAMGHNDAAEGATTDPDGHAYLTDANGDPIYVLIQGQQYPNTNLVKGAKGRVFNWYTNHDSQLYGIVPETTLQRDPAETFGMRETFFQTVQNSDERAYRGLFFLNLDAAEGMTANFADSDDLFYVVVYVITDAITDVRELMTSTENAATPSNAQRRADSATRTGNSPAVYTLFHPVRISDISMLTGIESLTGNVNNAPVEWYDMQGRRIGQPEPGNIYLKRQGSTVSKVRY